MLLNEFSAEILLILCILATWRLSHLIVAEDGPWEIIVKIRTLFGDSMAGKAMDCFYCTSIWIAIPFTFLISNNILSWIICWLAISGGAALLEQATNK